MSKMDNSRKTLNQLFVWVRQIQFTALAAIDLANEEFGSEDVGEMPSGAFFFTDEEIESKPSSWAILVCRAEHAKQRIHDLVDHGSLKAVLPDEFATPNSWGTRLLVDVEETCAAISLLKRSSKHFAKTNLNRNIAKLEQLSEALRLDSRLITAIRLPCQREPLGRLASLIFEQLLTLEEHKAMTGPKILEWLARKRHNVSPDRLNKEILPTLKPYGLKNKRQNGYYIPLSARPKKTQTK
jgi:hypothetical protein